MTEAKRAEGQIGSEEIELRALARLAEAMHVFRMRSEGRWIRRVNRGSANAQLGCAVNGGFEERGGFRNLRQQETVVWVIGIDTGGEIWSEAIHFAPLGAGVCNGECAAANEQRGDPGFGGTNITETGEAALETGAAGSGAGLRFEVFRKSNRAGDEKVGVFEQDNELMRAG